MGKVRKVAKAPVASVAMNGNVKQKKGKPMLFDGEPAQVRVGMGATLNMGNYESMRIGVDLTLPCGVKETDAAFKKAVQFVESKLDTLIRRHREGAVAPKSVEEIEL